MRKPKGKVTVSVTDHDEALKIFELATGLCPTCKKPCGLVGEDGLTVRWRCENLACLDFGKVHVSLWHFSGG